MHNQSVFSGISESPEVNSELSRKIAYWKGREKEVVAKRAKDKVDAFYNISFSLSKEVGAVVSPFRSTSPVRVSSPNRSPLLNSPTLTATPSSLIKQLSITTASPSSSSSPVSFPPPGLPPRSSSRKLFHSSSHPSSSLSPHLSIPTSSLLVPSVHSSLPPSLPLSSPSHLSSSIPPIHPSSSSPSSSLTHPSSSSTLLPVFSPPLSSSQSHVSSPLSSLTHPSSSSSTLQRVFPPPHSSSNLSPLSFPPSSPLHPSSSSLPPSHPFSPSHSSLPPSSSPSISFSPLHSFRPPPSPGHSPFKSPRLSIPVSTPRGRAGIRPSPTTPGGSAIPDVTVFWKGELAKKAKLLETQRKEKYVYKKQLITALKHLGVASISELPKVPGKVKPGDRTQAKEIKMLKRKLRLLKPLPVPVSAGNFVTKSSDGFLPCVRYAALKLASLGVSDGKQGEVMDVVAQMLDVRLSETPSKSTIRSWIPALTALNRMHAAEVLDQSEGGLTLLRDETTKKGDKIQQHAVSLARGDVLYLGFTAVPDKSAWVAFDSLRARVESLAPFSSASSPSQLFVDFTIKIKNMMSDRASTEICFNKIFKNVRDDFLELKEGWESLTSEEQETSKALMVHYCQLHAVSNLFGVVNGELVEHESEFRQDQVDSSSAGFAVIIREVGYCS